MVHALLSGAVTRAVCMGTPKDELGVEAFGHRKRILWEVLRDMTLALADAEVLGIPMQTD